MSLAEIEAELEKLTPDELRSLAMKSWTAFVEKEGRLEGADECDEDDPRLLTALDEAIAQVEILRCWDAHRQTDPQIRTTVE